MRVLVSGAAGKMGQAVCRAVADAQRLTLVGGVDLPGRSAPGVDMFSDLKSAVKEAKPDVVVDFTAPKSVGPNMEICFEEGVPMVIGTTGLSQTEIEGWAKRARETGWKAIIAPNFAIGAVLMMKFAQEAIAYFEQAEIIEYHHAQKLDAPSGTALRTAELIKARRSAAVPIHSVRLPGIVAQQDVILGLPGQTLTIRHHSGNRESFMPGVLLAIEKLPGVQGVIVGLEQILATDI